MLCEMAVMDPQAGDLKVKWDPANADEVAAAKAQFDALRAKGFAAYKLGRSGKQKDVLHTFDPTAEKMILRPAMVGG